MQVVGDDQLPKDRSVLYAVIPHGTFPFGLGVVRGAGRPAGVGCSTEQGRF